MNKGFHMILASGIRRRNCPFYAYGQTYPWDHGIKKNGYQVARLDTCRSGRQEWSWEQQTSEPSPKFYRFSSSSGAQDASHYEWLSIVRILVKGRAKTIAGLHTCQDSKFAPSAILATWS